MLCVGTVRHEPRSCPETTRTTNSLDPQDGRAVFLGPDFKRAESAESAVVASAPRKMLASPAGYLTVTSNHPGFRKVLCCRHLVPTRP